MAEIEIEKKKSIWPWILVAILLILALLYFFVWADDDIDDVDDMDDTTTEQVMQEEPQTNDSTQMTAVQEYSNYIDNPEMGIDHEYANGALLELIAATRSVAEKQNVNIEAELSEAKNKAEKITEDPMKLTHANKIKNSGETITRALQTLQDQKFPDMKEEYTAVEEALGKIQPDEETLNQKEAVKSFFEKAEELLISMK